MPWPSIFINSDPMCSSAGGSKHFNGAKRKDGRDLFRDFQTLGYDVAMDRQALTTIGKAATDRPLLGVFNASHISYRIDRQNDAKVDAKEPDLPEMTAVALKRLSVNPKGFVLQVEAGRIDHANHLNDAWAAIQEMAELDETLGVIEGYLKSNPDTLVVVAIRSRQLGMGAQRDGPPTITTRRRP